MKKISVLILVYQPQPSKIEQIAFDNIYNTFSEHNVTLIKPHSLDFRHLKEDYPLLSVESFDESYLQGINGFNRLMLADEFYERFADSEYILITNLDCYFFSDQILDFCEKEYDYLSTPYIGKKPFLLNPFSKGKGRFDKIMGCDNIALRKVDSHLAALKKYSEKRDHYLTNQLDENEFWAIEIPEFEYPSEQEALSFAFNKQPKYSYELNNYKLPIACCNWHSKGKIVDFWKDFIKE